VQYTIDAGAHKVELEIDCLTLNMALSSDAYDACGRRSSGVTSDDFGSLTCKSDPMCQQSTVTLGDPGANVAGGSLVREIKLLPAINFTDLK
jgi:hypothetical protein